MAERLLLSKELQNETKKLIKHKLYRLDKGKQCVVPVQDFFKILDDCEAKLTQKEKNDCLHHFEKKQGFIKYLDAVRFIYLDEYTG